MDEMTKQIFSRWPVLTTLFVATACLLISCSEQTSTYDEVVALDRDRVLDDAAEYMQKPVKTITSTSNERSSGGIHDFYSEGDYWWPDPENPEGPYIRKDGLTNPGNFTDHRLLMRELSLIVPNLTAAYLLTQEQKYADKAVEHMLAWFVDEEMLMNPNMLYSQAIFGRVTGRGIGIIDAIHLVEVVKAAEILEEKGVLTGDDLAGVKSWFSAFNQWITEHPYGQDERDNGNNHSVCWAMQVAMFASFTENDSLSRATVNFLKSTLIPEQMAKNGSFPKELARTKPYSYSLFNLDAMYTLTHILADVQDSELWNYTYQDSVSMKDGIDFMYPFIEDKSAWTYPEDVMYYEDWPMRHPSLLFAYLAYGESKYFELWKTLPASSDVNEIVRNFFVRQPILWIDNK